jgi:hypothetical protein
MALRQSLRQLGRILQVGAESQQCAALAGASRQMATSTVNGVPVEVSARHKPSVVIVFILGRSVDSMHAGWCRCARLQPVPVFTFPNSTADSTHGLHAFLLICTIHNAPKSTTYSRTPQVVLFQRWGQAPCCCSSWCQPICKPPAICSGMRQQCKHCQSTRVWSRLASVAAAGLLATCERCEACQILFNSTSGPCCVCDCAGAQ